MRDTTPLPPDEQAEYLLRVLRGGVDEILTRAYELKTQNEQKLSRQSLNGARHRYVTFNKLPADDSSFDKVCATYQDFCKRFGKAPVARTESPDYLARFDAHLRTRAGAQATRLHTQ